MYPRIQSKTADINVYLINEILEEKMTVDNLEGYSKTAEIANALNLRTHNLITDKKGNGLVQ